MTDGYPLVLDLLRIQAELLRLQIDQTQRIADEATCLADELMEVIRVAKTIRIQKPKPRPRPTDSGQQGGNPATGRPQW